MWKLPPIVGEIIDRQAKIVFEVMDKSSLVHYRIKEKSHHVPVESSGPTNVLLKFKKDGIYIIHWLINNQLQYQHQVIISNHIKKLIFVSCDLLEADTKHSLWHRMIQEVSNERVAIMHLGDQAYMDPVFNECKKILTDSISLNHLQECFELYGNRYCDTWRPHIELLSNVSNYYLWDDHEIYNDIQLDNINDEITRNIANVAVKAYDLYQQSFHINKTNVINQYCWVKYVNEGVVIMTIERTSRDIELNEIFDAILKLEKVETLILCFSSAPIPRPQGFYGKIYGSLKGFGKFWDQEELLVLYQWLFTWMGEKQVIVVGGDVHFGVYGHMMKGDLTIPVIIASPITNQPYADRSLASKGMSVHRLDDITFTTISTKAKRCYATLDLDTMAINMVYSQNQYPKNKMKYIKTLSKF